MFGPSSKVPRAHVQSICQEYTIPHISAQWDPREITDYFAINVYPDNAIVGGAHADLVRFWGWKEFTVIYEDDDSKCLTLTSVNLFPYDTILLTTNVDNSYLLLFKWSCCTLCNKRDNVAFIRCGLTYIVTREIYRVLFKRMFKCCFFLDVFILVEHVFQTSKYLFG